MQFYCDNHGSPTYSGYVKSNVCWTSSLSLENFAPEAADCLFWFEFFSVRFFGFISADVPQVGIDCFQSWIFSDQAVLVDHFAPDRRPTLQKAGHETWTCAWSPDGLYFAWSCGARIVKLMPWNRHKHCTWVSSLWMGHYGVWCSAWLFCRHLPLIEICPLIVFIWIIACTQLQVLMRSVHFQQVFNQSRSR